jgi:3'-5' exonuclease
MLDELKLENVLFLDIETAPCCPDYASLSDTFQKLWDKKSLHFRKENELGADVYARAGIYAEFGKIICISVGIMTRREENHHFRIKSFFDDDERSILLGFSEMVERFSANREVSLCAHNGKEFDFPYISRRMLINSIKIPKILDVAGKKPWETKFLDTLELWKFGDIKNYTSLELLANLFGIPSPKDDIDGSMVGEVYWKERNLKRIAKYCEKDVLAVAQLLLRYKGEKLINEDVVESVSQQ